MENDYSWETYSKVFKDIEHAADEEKWLSENGFPYKWVGGIAHLFYSELKAKGGDETKAFCGHLRDEEKYFTVVYDPASQRTYKFTYFFYPHIQEFMFADVEFQGKIPLSTCITFVKDGEQQDLRDNYNFGRLQDECKRALAEVANSLPENERPASIPGYVKEYGYFWIQKGLKRVRKAVKNYCLIK